MRKGKGQESMLRYSGHALMENRHGLCVDLTVISALTTETQPAKAIRERQRRKRVQPSSLGADKGYHYKDFVAHLRQRRIVAQCAASFPAASWDRQAPVTSSMAAYRKIPRRHRLAAHGR
jgi:hypothetical protein